MTDRFGIILFGVAAISIAVLITTEFIKAFRAREISAGGAGRITVATGLLMVIAAPSAYYGLDQASRSTMFWFGAGLVALGFLLQMLNERKNKRNGQ